MVLCEWEVFAFIVFSTGRKNAWNLSLVSLIEAVTDRVLYFSITTFAKWTHRLSNFTLTVTFLFSGHTVRRADWRLRSTEPMRRRELYRVGAGRVHLHLSARVPRRSVQLPRSMLLYVNLIPKWNETNAKLSVWLLTESISRAFSYRTKFKSNRIRTDFRISNKLISRLKNLCTLNVTLYLRLAAACKSVLCQE